MKSDIEQCLLFSNKTTENKNLDQNMTLRFLEILLLAHAEIRRARLDVGMCTWHMCTSYVHMNAADV